MIFLFHLTKLLGLGLCSCRFIHSTNAFILFPSTSATCTHGDTYLIVQALPSNFAVTDQGKRGKEEYNNGFENDKLKNHSNLKKTITSTQEDELDALLKEALFRMSFFMSTDYLFKTKNRALRSLFETCIDSVYISDSTIPEAGRGLFAGKDIPKGTIIAFYPVDCIGFKFGTGLCNSVQLAENQNEMIDVESSSYALFSLVNRNLCGVDLLHEYDYDGRLFVDMNPNNTLNPGWYCGLMNDAATVQCHDDLNYYPKSRSYQNVEIVPFSTAPFQVGVTTKFVKEGEELFVSYGYSYWYNRFLMNEDDTLNQWKLKSKAIEDQEYEAEIQMYKTVDSTEEQYKEESWILSYIFNNMSSFEPPPDILPEYPQKEKSKRSRLLSMIGGTIQRKFNNQKR